MEKQILLDNLVKAVQFTLMYGNNDGIVKSSNIAQQEYKKQRREFANNKKVEWTVVDVEDFKTRLGRKWKITVDNFAKLLKYAEAQLKYSMPNDNTKQKWTLADDPSISLSRYHLTLQEIFADDKTTIDDYKEGGKLEHKVKNIIELAVKTNFITCVDNTYSPKNAEVNFTRLYKFNPHISAWVASFVPAENCGNVDNISTSSSSTHDYIPSPYAGHIRENIDLSTFYKTYKLDKFNTPMTLEHTPNFIKEIIQSKYAPLVIYPDYTGDDYMDSYNLNYKLKLNKKGELEKISCREWTPFTQTTNEQKEGFTFRDDVCEEYFGENYYNWDVNGSIYRMTAAINNKKLDNDTDVYEQLWPFDKSLFTPVLRKSFKHLCMCAYMTRKQDDFIKGVAKMCDKKLPDEVKEYCNIIWNHMRELIGESYRTEALFVAGCFEKIVKFALVRRFKNTILQCYDCFYGAQYDIGVVSKKIYDEILANEDALDVVRDVLAGRKPKSTLQEIFKNII